MSSIRPKVILDCNVLLQAVARERGPAAQCIRLVEGYAIALYVSKPILREVGKILSDAVVRSVNLGLSDAIVNSFLRKIAYRGQLVRQVPPIFDFPRDPKDEMYIDLAAAVDADFLVTRDKDLLALASGHDLISKQFRQRFPRLDVLDPFDFLDHLRDIGAEKP